MPQLSSHPPFACLGGAWCLILEVFRRHLLGRHNCLAFHEVTRGCRKSTLLHVLLHDRSCLSEQAHFRRWQQSLAVEGTRAEMSGYKRFQIFESFHSSYYPKHCNQLSILPSYHQLKSSPHKTTTINHNFIRTCVNPSSPSSPA
jgi:hypothetical protein